MSILVSMGRFIHTVRYQNPKKKGIKPHISGLVEDGVCALHIDLDPLVSAVLLLVMCFSSDKLDVVLAHDLYKGFHLFHVGIFVAYMGMCTILTDEGLQLMTPLSLCYHSIYIP